MKPNWLYIPGNAAKGNGSLRSRGRFMEEKTKVKDIGWAKSTLEEKYKNVREMTSALGRGFCGINFGRHNSI